jgi:hypothetical protein
MTVKEHLATFHKEAAKFHAASARHHAALAKCFSNVSKSESIESESDISAAHEGLSEQHLSLAEFHLNCCEDLMSKAMSMGTDRDDQIRPDGISSIIGDAPNIRPVPRYGQQQFARTEIPQELEKLVSLDD